MILQIYFDGEKIRDFGNKSKVAWECYQISRELITKLAGSDPVTSHLLVIHSIPED